MRAAVPVHARWWSAGSSCGAAGIVRRVRSHARVRCWRPTACKAGDVLLAAAGCRTRCWWMNKGLASVVAGLIAGSREDKPDDKWNECVRIQCSNTERKAELSKGGKVLLYLLTVAADASRFLGCYIQSIQSNACGFLLRLRRRIWREARCKRDYFTLLLMLFIVE